MPSDRSRRALLAIYDHAVLACGFVGAMAPEAFAADRRTFLAACRCLEIISEAARRLDPEVRERLSAVPWKDVISAGNIYRHDYDRVTEDRVYVSKPDNLAKSEAGARLGTGALNSSNARVALVRLNANHSGLTDAYPKAFYSDSDRPYILYRDCLLSIIL